MYVTTSAANVLRFASPAVCLAICRSINPAISDKKKSVFINPPIKDFYFLCEVNIEMNMIYKFDKTATDGDLKDLIERIKINRIKRNKPNFIEFFGALPHIGDGLEYQKQARDEWD